MTIREHLEAAERWSRGVNPMVWAEVKAALAQLDACERETIWAGETICRLVPDPEPSA